MTPAEFQRLFEQRLGAIKQYARQELPRRIGKMAVDHYHENFMQGGYVDESLQPWQPAKRIGRTTDASGGYGTLLSRRKMLYNSIRALPAEIRVTVSSSLRYSRIHNEGGTITQPITPKMRKFAWAKYYESGGTSEAMKGLALTKKTSRTITIPRRQFMGHSAKLNQAIHARIVQDVKRILQGN